MDQIWVYDIASSQWMQQKATGDIPNGRVRTCSGLVPSPDLSSYQIYVFSGVSIGDSMTLDMYVLSVPAFVWTKIDLVDYPSQWGIADTACMFTHRDRTNSPLALSMNCLAADGDVYRWSLRGSTIDHCSWAGECQQLCKCE